MVPRDGRTRREMARGLAATSTPASGGSYPAHEKVGSAWIAELETIERAQKAPAKKPTVRMGNTPFRA